jgi:DNA repair protein RadA/Sms
MFKRKELKRLANAKLKFCCKTCGTEHAKWQGKCNGCEEWNTLEEETYFTGKAAKGAKTIIRDGNMKAKSLTQIDEQNFQGFSSGMAELDRALGGKVITGSLVLISAEPGKGKSTLITQISQYIGENVGKVLYFSGEESEYQIKLRAERLGVTTNNLFILYTKDMETVENVVEEEQPVFIIIDSIQTLGDPSIPSEPGSVSQVKNCTGRLVNIAKGKGITTFMIGQVTKDSVIAGPKMLEHMVDTVLFLEGDRYSDMRLLRVNKNRFGSTNELGVFEMKEEGLVEISNPSEYLLSNRKTNMSGSAVACISDTRPLLIEVQALVSPLLVPNSIPRRTSEGYSRNRLSILLAVLEKLCGVQLTFKDVYINVVGGIEIEDPGADLAIAMALYSSDVNKVLDPQTAIIGEIGLTGEVRPVAQIEQIVQEMERIGFATCILPTKNYERMKGKTKTLILKPVDTLKDAIKILF